jgi:hypothetical protein
MAHFNRAEGPVTWEALHTICGVIALGVTDEIAHSAASPSEAAPDTPDVCESCGTSKFKRQFFSQTLVNVLEQNALERGRAEGRAEALKQAAELLRSRTNLVSPNCASELTHLAYQIENDSAERAREDG